MKTLQILIALSLLLHATACTTKTGSEAFAGLPMLGAAGAVSVSGLSSGAYMATQVHLALSARVSGAGLVAGGPWGCAQGSVQQALGPCLTGDGLDVGVLREQATALADSERVAPLSNFSGDKVFAFHGSNDAVVGEAAVTAAATFYEGLADGISVIVETGIGVTHGWPTVSQGMACTEFAAPFINACGYDLAGKLLQLFHGELQPPSEASGNLLVFKQDGAPGAGLADDGYVYVPQACADEPGCGVHVFFHGCNQSAGQVDTALIEAAGFNEWAESNAIVVLYPQVEASRFAPLNPLGCWDWWGYSGEDYLSAEAPQIAAVAAMLGHLAGEAR